MTENHTLHLSRDPSGSAESFGHRSAKRVPRAIQLARGASPDKSIFLGASACELTACRTVDAISCGSGHTRRIPFPMFTEENPSPPVKRKVTVRGAPKRPMQQGVSDTCDTFQQTSPKCHQPSVTVSRQTHETV